MTSTSTYNALQPLLTTSVEKVSAIYEDKDEFSADSGLITLLADSLRAVCSEIEHHVAFPPLSSLSVQNGIIEEELRKLRNRSNRIFILLQSSLEFAVLLFEKDKQMAMMDKGYVWIATDEIASLLDSLDSSTIYNMQGVLGFRTNSVESMKSFRQFKTKFKNYGLRYFEDQVYLISKLMTRLGQLLKPWASKCHIKRLI